MDETLELTGVILMGTKLHARLRTAIQDGDVSHSLEAVVILEYPGEDIMDITLRQIEADARNRLALGERPL